MKDYILFVVLILASCLLFFLLRKNLNFGFRNKRISAFKNDVQIYLKQNYPKINFDYSVFDKTQNEKDMAVRQMLIAERLAMQFARYDFEFDTQAPVDSKLLWDTYEMQSRPVKNKRPNDLRRRKELTHNRDHKACIRCGLPLALNDATLATIKPFGQKGTYHFENLATLCKDCYKVLKKTDAATIAHDSKLLQDIIKKIH